jgi:hypothetical protein
MVLGWSGKTAPARLKPLPAQLADTPPPYLRVIGQLPLRFQPLPARPEATARPAAGGPPIPATSATETAKSPAVTPEASPASTDVSLVPAPPKKADPAPIIPDELRPRVQAEDFLPFFQFPGGPDAPSVQLVVPTNPPHRATPSTATYRQQ